MATQADLRQGIGTLVDELGPYIPRTFTAGTCTATQICSSDLANLPNDSTLLVGGYILKADGTQTYVSGPFTQSSGCVGVVSGSVPSPGDQLEYWKNFQPLSVNARIKNAWNEIRRKVWVPVVQVHTVRDFYRRLYTLPNGWSHLNLVQWAPALARGGVSGQITGTVPGGVPGPNLKDFQNVGDVTANTRVAQGIQLQNNVSLPSSNDTWIRYIALYLGNGTAARDVAGTITLAVQSDSAGSPSGTTLIGATRDYADIPYMPQWVVFDLGTPYRFQAGTQYHLVLTTSMSVNPTNYIRWARTSDTSIYTGGVMKTYNGSTWSAPGYDGLFLVYSEQGGWLTMEKSEWDVRVPRQLDLRDYQAVAASRARQVIVPDGTLIRLEGTRLPAQPSDTTNLEIPYDYVLAKVAYDMTLSRLKTPGFDPDDWQDRLRAWSNHYMEAETTGGVFRRPQGARRILDTDALADYY